MENGIAGGLLTQKLYYFLDNIICTMLKGILILSSRCRELK